MKKAGTPNTRKSLSPLGRHLILSVLGCCSMPGARDYYSSLTNVALDGPSLLEGSRLACLLPVHAPRTFRSFRRRLRSIRIEGWLRACTVTAPPLGVEDRLRCAVIKRHIFIIIQGDHLSIALACAGFLLLFLFSSLLLSSTLLLVLRLFSSFLLGLFAFFLLLERFIPSQFVIGTGVRFRLPRSEAGIAALGCPPCTERKSLVRGILK